MNRHLSRALLVSCCLVLAAAPGTARAGGKTMLPVSLDCELVPPPARLLDLEPLQVVVGQSCARATFETGPGWLISASVRDDIVGGHVLIHAVTDGRGRRVSLTRESATGERYFRAKQAADFDGDGAPEIVGTEVVHAPDSVTTRLVVLAVRATGVARVLNEVIRLEVDPARHTGDGLVGLRGDQMIRCTSEHAVREDGGRARVEIAAGKLERERHAPAGAALAEAFCPRRARVFTWSGKGRLIAQGAATELAAEAGELDPRCPSRPLLVRLLEVRRGQSLRDVRCLHGMFPGRGIAVSGVTYDATDEEAGTLVIAVADGRGRLLSRHRRREYSEPGGMFERGELHDAADLNGDGRDELLVVTTVDTQEGQSSWLRVLRQQGRSWREVSSQPLGSSTNVNWVPRAEYDPAPHSPADTLACRAAVRMEKRSGGPGVDLVIERQVERGAKVAARHVTNFCQPARERLRMSASGQVTPADAAAPR